MPSKIIKKHAWSTILKDVVYNHQSDSIEFTIKDVESLSAYVTRKQSIVDSQNDMITRLQKQIVNLQTQLLAEALSPKAQKVSSFSTYG